MREAFRELAQVDAAPRDQPRPIPRPPGAPCWPPEQPAFGADWADGEIAYRGPSRGARARLVMAGLGAVAAFVLAVVVVVVALD